MSQNQVKPGIEPNPKKWIWIKYYDKVLPAITNYPNLSNMYSMAPKSSKLDVPNYLCWTQRHCSAAPDVSMAGTLDSPSSPVPSVATSGEWPFGSSWYIHLGTGQNLVPQYTLIIELSVYPAHAQAFSKCSKLIQVVESRGMETIGWVVETLPLRFDPYLEIDITV